MRRAAGERRDAGDAENRLIWCKFDKNYIPDYNPSAKTQKSTHTKILNKKICGGGKMLANKYDFLIIGSGCGGATLARELGRRKKKVLVIERGQYETKTGTFGDSRRYYSHNILPIPKKSKEGVIIWHTFMAGGSTVVSCGNGVRCLEKELSDLGINLTDEFNQAEQEMHINPISERLLSNGSKAIRQAANELGYKMELMPKFIDPKLCRKCGNCTLGCIKGAKWTALEYLKEALESGVEILYNTKAEEVIIENGKAKGIRYSGKGGAGQIFADNVILAAGGANTPVILQKSGMKDAGKGFFADLLVNVYGVTDDEKLNHTFEPTMALVNLDFHRTNGFLLSPFVNHPTLVKFIEFGVKGLTIPDKKTLGIMVKTTDEPAGSIYPDGTISKPVTENDWKRLNEGSKIAKEILLKAGARSTMVSVVEGGHPGGTSAIGKIVDKNLQTKIEGLFICDASVLPTAPGLPPIVTIVALAKYLAKILP
jgi:choline dehydrogenase-like flavoprotein